MERKLNLQDEIASILLSANQMARRYGTIGNCDPGDIAQDAVIRFLKRKGDRAFTRGWLYKTVRSVAYDAGRSYARELQNRSFLDAEQFQSVCEHVDQDGCLVTAGTYTPQRDDGRDLDLLRRVNAMLQQLTEPLREILILCAADLTLCVVSSYVVSRF